MRNQRRKNKFCLLTLGLCILLSWPLVFTVESFSAVKPEAPAENKGEQAKAVSDSEQLKDLLKTYFTYRRENRPDPFATFIKKQKPQAAPAKGSAPVQEEEVLTGMQLFEPGQLTLVSIIFAGDDALAMVQDSLGQGYVLKKGTKIGRRGIVEDILPNVLLIKEWSLTFAGEKRYKNIEMVLRKEGE